jgi:hypothetical protein
MGAVELDEELDWGELVEEDREGGEAEEDGARAERIVTGGGADDRGAPGQMSGRFSMRSRTHLAVCWTLSVSSWEGSGGSFRMAENRKRMSSRILAVDGCRWRDTRLAKDG